MMLHYMYEHFIDKFEWFARADDDVFVRTDKLEKFLRSIDSSKPQFIGKYYRHCHLFDSLMEFLLMASQVVD